MAAETNLIKKNALARVREIEFTEMFGYSIKKLMEALGVTRKIAKQAGTVLKSYKATGTLESGVVAEGEVEVSRTLSMASMAVFTAVSKPMV